MEISCNCFTERISAIQLDFFFFLYQGNAESLCNIKGCKEKSGCKCLLLKGARVDATFQWLEKKK